MDKNKTITFISETLAGGGAERVVSNLATYLSDLGWEIDFVLTRLEGDFIDQLSPKVKIIDLNSKNIYLSFLSLVRYLKENQPPVILSSLDLMNLATILAVRVAKVKTKTIIRVDNSVSQQKRTKIKKVLEKFFLSRIYPLADQIIIVSNEAADDLAKYINISRKNIEVIYSPVISPDIKEKMTMEVNHPWIDDPEIPVILSIGRLNTQKNYSRLLRVFSKLRKEIDARLLILGEGEGRGRLTQEIKTLGIENEVEMLGFVDNPYAFLRKAAVFALSSDHEGLPTVLIESLACGCHVVSVDCPSGPKEILDGGKYGHLVPMNDEKLFVESLIKVIGGEKKQVPEIWLEQFTLTYASNEYIRLIEKVINK